MLTEDEDNELEDALEELSLRQSFDVTIATIESMESVGADSMEQFADDLYDYCQYGYGPDMDAWATASGTSPPAATVSPPLRMPASSTLASR